MDSVFEGYNGTIMAYGQTGSGKTFTMSGNFCCNHSVLGAYARTSHNQDCIHCLYIPLSCCMHAGPDTRDKASGKRGIMPRAIAQVHLRSFPVYNNSWVPDFIMHKGQTSTA